MKYLFCLLFIFGCGDLNPFKKDNEKKDPIPTPIKILVQQANRYCEWEYPRYQTRGYVHSKCDGAGFTSLHALKCPNIHLDIFTDEEGKLWRSPTKDCMKNGESKSESSKDMHLMRMFTAFLQNDISYFNKVITYGTENNWVMCKVSDIESASRCILTPSLIDLLYDARIKLKGVTPSLKTFKEESLADIPLNKGYQAHLEILKIGLIGYVYGQISDWHLSRLKGYAKRENQNALFQFFYHMYQDGNMMVPILILESFPRSYLPTSSQWCTKYLWQRDQDSDSWLPCPLENQTHDGTDFGLVVYLLEKYLSK